MSISTFTEDALVEQPAISLFAELGWKAVAHDLPEKLKRERLVLDWKKRQQTRAAVEVTIRDMLDNLPDAYTRAVYAQKCALVYQHVYDSYYGQGRSVYVA